MDYENNEKIEEEKHFIAILVELGLYKIIEGIDNENTKQKEKEKFIQECLTRAKYINEQQIREHVQLVLNRTKRNREKFER